MKPPAGRPSPRAAQRATRGPARAVKGLAHRGPLLVLAGFALLVLLVVWNTRPGLGAQAAMASQAPPPAGVEPATHAARHREAEVARRFQEAVAMLHARQYEHASTSLHRVLELAPQMPEAHVNMGYALLGLGRHAAARDFFDGAIALRPDQANAYYGLATAVEALGDLPAAIAAMRSYLHLARNERESHLRRARAALWEWESRPREPVPNAR